MFSSLARALNRSRNAVKSTASILLLVIACEAAANEYRLMRSVKVAHEPMTVTISQVKTILDRLWHFSLSSALNESS